MNSKYCLQTHHLALSHARGAQAGAVSQPEAPVPVPLRLRAPFLPKKREREREREREIENAESPLVAAGSAPRLDSPSPGAGRAPLQGGLWLGQSSRRPRAKRGGADGPAGFTPGEPCRLAVKAPEPVLPFHDHSCGVLYRA